MDTPGGGAGGVIGIVLAIGAAATVLWGAPRPLPLRPTAAVSATERTTHVAPRAPDGVPPSLAAPGVLPRRLTLPLAATIALTDPPSGWNRGPIPDHRERTRVVTALGGRPGGSMPVPLFTPSAPVVVESPAPTTEPLSTVAPSGTHHRHGHGHGHPHAPHAPGGRHHRHHRDDS